MDWEALQQTARHEVAHAAMAAAMKLTVLRVDAARHHTDLALPCGPDTVSAYWRADPIHATVIVVAMIATIQAPVWCRATVTPFQAEDDRCMLTAWRDAWNTLVRSAPATTSSWTRQPGARLPLFTLARALAAAGTLDAAGWTRLWEQERYAPLRTLGGPLLSDELFYAPAPPPRSRRQSRWTLHR